MRIIYLADFYTDTNQGVLKKIKNQVRKWEEARHEVQVLVTSLGDGQKEPVCLKVFSSNLVRYVPTAIRQYANRVLSASEVSRSIKHFNPDLIYYRQSIYYPGLISCLRLSSCIMEVNTDDEGEKLQHGYFARKYYFAGKHRIMKNIDGLVCVSNEITDKYLKYDKPVTTIANGLDTQSQNNKKRIAVPEQRPQIIFATSPNQYWQGIDKLITLAGKCPEYDFHLVGEKIDHPPLNLFCYGYMQQKMLFDLYEKIDFGIGTLALHRKQMQEASPLKTREYALHGLPMIVGFKDTDLEDEEFVLNIGNYENNVNESVPQIRAFIERWRGKRIDRQRVYEKLSNNIKEARRLDFFEQIIQSVYKEES